MDRSPQVSFLIAFRDVDGSRTRLWRCVRELTEHHFPDAEIVVGTDDGRDPFHKTRALNDAASRAMGDVFVVWDADTWLHPERVRAAVSLASEDAACWQKPYAAKVKLNQEATEHVLALGLEWDGTLDRKVTGRPEHTTTFHGAPPFVLHREAFEAVGGFDERFRGWGQEDEAMWQALTRIVGPEFRGHRGWAGIPNTAIHLWHPRIGRSGNDLWQGQTDEQRAANRVLGDRYKRARTREHMAALIAERQPVEV